MSKELKEYTREEIEGELQRRGPKTLPHRNFSGVYDQVTTFVEALAAGDKGAARGHKQYIYEAAIEAVYGNVWGWINGKLEDMS